MNDLSVRLSHRTSLPDDETTGDFGKDNKDRGKHNAIKGSITETNGLFPQVKIQQKRKYP